MRKCVMPIYKQLNWQFYTVYDKIHIFFHFPTSSRSVAMVAAELLYASRAQSYNITLKPPCSRCLSMTLHTDFNKMSFTLSISQFFTIHESL
jgi:hypothetical protein